jgi:flagellar assembly protein FliH
MARLFWEAAVATVLSNQVSGVEQIPAWERWHPGALYNDKAQPSRAPESPEAVEQRARAAGFEQGKQAGVQTGYNEGRARAQAEAAQIHAVALAAQAALQALGDTLARKTVALATAIAQKIIQREIQSHPESVLDVVRDALTMLPEGAGRVRLLVNSTDAQLVRLAMSSNALLADCVVVGSDEVQRGGCRIVAPGGDIDATLATRTARVLEALGMQDEPPQ